jgi:hypothetical protein
MEKLTFSQASLYTAVRMRKTWVAGPTFVWGFPWRGCHFFISKFNEQLEKARVQQRMAEQMGVQH